MKTQKIARALIVLVILISNISCDQISKGVVRQHIGYHERIGLLNNYLTLTKVENTGAFLSLGDSLPGVVKIFILMALPVMAMAFGLFYLLTRAHVSRMMLIGFSFAIGGGIGNIFDRIAYGSVTDFLHIDFVLFQTGIFNMADVSIMTGMCIVLVHSIMKR